MSSPTTHLLASLSLASLAYLVTRTMLYKSFSDILQPGGHASESPPSLLSLFINLSSLSVGLFVSVWLHHSLDHIYEPIVKPILKLIWWFLTATPSGGGGGTPY